MCVRATHCTKHRHYLSLPPNYQTCINHRVHWKHTACYTSCFACLCTTWWSNYQLFTLLWAAFLASVTQSIQTRNPLSWMTSQSRTYLTQRIPYPYMGAEKGGLTQTSCQPQWETISSVCSGVTVTIPHRSISTKRRSPCYYYCGWLWYNNI